MSLSRSRPKKPFIPPERHETIRRQIEAVIEEKSLTAGDISAEVRISEKDVCGHLEHIQKSIGREGGDFIVTPAECLDCGFVFRKRERLKTPGKCPVCNSESIREPLYKIIRGSR